MQTSHLYMLAGETTTAQSPGPLPARRLTYLNFQNDYKRRCFCKKIDSIIEKVKAHKVEPDFTNVLTEKIKRKLQIIYQTMSYQECMLVLFFSLALSYNNFLSRFRVSS